MVKLPRWRMCGFRVYNILFLGSMLIGIAISALVLTIGIASSSLITTSTFCQDLTQGNQTGNQTANQTSPAPAQIPGSASEGSSGSSGPQY